MPYFKCTSCRTRLYCAGSSAELVGDLCPGCGSLLEPVLALREIVGFRVIASRGGAVDLPRRSRTVGHLAARRQAHDDTPARIQAAFAARQTDL